MRKENIAVGASFGYIIASIFNSILVIVKETNVGVEKWLIYTFGHHWIGHGILIVLAFILASLLALYLFKDKEVSESTLKKVMIATVIFTFISVAIIAGFYLSEL
jgi:prolipoprotein diacylglyceryltransferase